MKNKLSWISLCAVSLSLVFSTGNVLASNDESYVTKIEGPLTEVTENLGVSEGNPDISTYGLDIPTSTHNVNNEPMSFKGSGNSTLYTNSFFTGSSSYLIKISNYHSETLRVNLWKKGGWLRTDTTITPSGSTNWWFPPVSFAASDSYYLQFVAPGNFSGTVEK